MSRTILTFAEVRNNELRQVALEAVSAAVTISESAPADIASCLLVQENTAADLIARYAASLFAQGARRVYVVKHAGFTAYHAELYTSAVQQIVAAASPEFMIFGHTAVGRDLAPRLASALQAGQISDITAIAHQDGQLRYTRPLYAGKAVEQRAFAAGSSAASILTIRPNNIPLGAVDPSRTGEVIEVAFTPPSLRTIVRNVVRKTSGALDLSEAKIIVSGGRGVKSADGFKPLEELAAVLNGAVGASRGACDAGYCDYGLQIGQTGKVVTPEIYIACGISGAIQHLAGMSGSRVIIAVNKDPEAPIFKVADYGIVGDLFEVVPLLTTAFREFLEHEA
ncbi:electron transfer flavoprotein subunit alpha/FixB family protein [Paenibacillus guangzhouensis]|uniref:electron transfer flavoprotein subunit alpha/FixB family protein n=1 Tax=Paenibacillus guangzhouensis TaxID=1473112 RepID=UPI0012676F47|nr:electron transfer flavoprotein subunit alpha/FixB family protein [Paenibacillus guangzhouensis]